LQEGGEMKADYWDVTDEQVIEKTGKSLEHWRKVLDALGAVGKNSNESVAHLQNDHGVPRYWARTLTTWYLKQQAS
jgi:Domain of unknown function (DUF4287)